MRICSICIELFHSLKILPITFQGLTETYSCHSLSVNTVSKSFYLFSARAEIKFECFNFIYERLERSSEQCFMFEELN